MAIKTMVPMPMNIASSSARCGNRYPALPGIDAVKQTRPSRMQLAAGGNQIGTPRSGRPDAAILPVRYQAHLPRGQ